MVQERVLCCVLCRWVMLPEMLFDGAAEHSIHPIYSYIHAPSQMHDRQDSGQQTVDSGQRTGK